MKKRLKGLLCLWLAVLVVAVPAVRAVSAAETDAEGNPYLYVYRGEKDLSQRDQVLDDGEETRKTTFHFDESLYQQSNIMLQVPTPVGREIDGWKVWRYYSGLVYTPNLDGQPDTLLKDGTITREYYEKLIDGDSSSYILLEPVFKQMQTIILPEVRDGYEINAAEWITLNGSPAYTFTVTIDATHEAADNFAVLANGVELKPTKMVGSHESTYVIENITETQTISIVGVVNRINPQLKIQFSNGVYWDNFHQVVGVTGIYKYFNEAQTITMSTSTSEGEKSDGIRYMVASGDLVNWDEVTADDKTLALELAVEKAGGWAPYEGPIKLENDGTYVVYAKSADAEFNYANTEMFVIDRTAPQIWNESAGNGIDGLQYKGDLTFSVEDDNLDSVTVDDEKVDLVDNEYTITADCSRHTIEARDKAGNVTKVSVYVFDEYRISKTAAEGGSFTVMCEGEEVTVAEPNSEIVVTASADDNYIVDEITVTKTGDESTQVTVTDGKFTMLSYPVTVTVNFQKKAYPVTLPALPTVGYTVTPVDGSVSPAFHGSDFVFTVTIEDGYKASDSYSVSANQTVLTPVIDGNTYTYTIKNITEEQVVTIRGIVSATAPSVAVTVGNDSTQWTDFLPEINFDYFFNKTITIDVSATEADSGTKLTEIWYYIADGDLFPENRAYTDQEIEEAVSKWTGYTDGITLSENGEHVIYVKAMDSNGNVAYVNTAGIVIDTVLPTIFGVENGGVYYGDTLIRASDDNLDTVMVDGIAVQLTNGTYTIAADNQSHTVTATDKAGNQISYELYTFETWVRDGIQTAGTLRLTAGTGYRLGSGKWKVSGDETVYEGGNSFYVAESGSYVFSQQ